MGGGADDLLARQASQPAYSLVQEGGELVGLDPVGLRPRVAQLGGDRVERPKPPMPREASAGLRDARIGSRGLAAAARCCGRQDRLALQDGRCTHQAEAPVFFTSEVTVYSSSRREWSPWLRRAGS